MELESYKEELSDNIVELGVLVEKYQQAWEEEHNLYLRAVADFTNYRKRMEQRNNEMAELATERVIAKILPIIDDINRMIQYTEGEANWDMINLILRKLNNILDHEGVKSIDANYLPFDPTFHEAIGSIRTDKYPEHTVIEYSETGYTLHGKVIRPAKVQVAVSED